MSIDRNTNTVGDIISNVYRLFGDESAAQVNEQDIISAINIAQMDVVSLNRHINGVYSEFPVTAGQSVYDLSILPDIHRILSIHYLDTKLEGMTFQEAESRILGVESDAEPCIWWTFASGLHIYPTPKTDHDIGLKIFFNKKPATVTQPGDLLGVPDSHFSAVLNAVMKYVYEMDENAAMAKMKSEDFGRNIESNIQDTYANNSQHPVIRDVYGDY